jgi:hypothetical protein
LSSAMSVLSEADGSKEPRLTIAARGRIVDCEDGHVVQP